MKTKNFHLPLLFFGFATLSLTSCEKDEALNDNGDSETTPIEKDESLSENTDSEKTTTDDDLEASGSITVTTVTDEYLYDETISTAWYTLSSTDPDDLPTLTLFAFFQTALGSTDEDMASFMTKNQGRIVTIRHIDQNVDKIVVGPLESSGTLSLDKIERDGNYYEWSTTDTFFSGGEVSITNVEANRYLTVEFKNCQFYTDDTERLFNGTIKFPVKK